MRQFADAASQSIDSLQDELATKREAFEDVRLVNVLLTLKFPLLYCIILFRPILASLYYIYLSIVVGSLLLRF